MLFCLTMVSSHPSALLVLSPNRIDSLGVSRLQAGRFWEKGRAFPRLTLSVPLLFSVSHGDGPVGLAHFLIHKQDLEGKLARGPCGSSLYQNVACVCNYGEEGSCHWGEGGKEDELVKETPPTAPSRAPHVVTADKPNRSTLAFTRLCLIISIAISTIAVGTSFKGTIFRDPAPGESGLHCSPGPHHIADML